jgi:hypothetical protein
MSGSTQTTAYLKGARTFIAVYAAETIGVGRPKRLPKCIGAGLTPDLGRLKGVKVSRKSSTSEVSCRGGVHYMSGFEVLSDLQ